VYRFLISNNDKILGLEYTEHVIHNLASSMIKEFETLKHILSIVVSTNISFNKAVELNYTQSENKKVVLFNNISF
jgi:anionic cell wall polymer biosynthesis LytR-Cps2A-Psr (LCP) family protein